MQKVSNRFAKFVKISIYEKLKITTKSFSRAVQQLQKVELLGVVKVNVWAVMIDIL